MNGNMIVTSLFGKNLCEDDLMKDLKVVFDLLWIIMNYAFVEPSMVFWIKYGKARLRIILLRVTQREYRRVSLSRIYT